MANTFSQIYLQFVFAVKARRSLIPRENKEELHKYMTGLVQNRKCKMLAVHCMPDHCHLFVGYKPTVFMPDFIKEIKVESNDSLMRKNGIWENLAGRRDMVSFHILNRILAMLCSI